MEDRRGHDEIIGALISGRSMCVTCIAAKASVGVDTVGNVLETIGSTLKLHRQADRCVVCGETKLIHFVARAA